MSQPLPTVSKGTEAIFRKLEAALNADGDFPVRARAVAELRKLVNDPNTPVEKIVDVILSEPSLGTRILHLVNSVYYKRNQPVLTVSQAVVQLGMRALCDLCSGFVLMQRFSPAAQKGGVFADNVKKCILCSTLTTSLLRQIGKEENIEQGYLAATFLTIGPLLLAYYFPQVFEQAEKRARARGQTVTLSVTETIGIAPVGLSLGVVDSLAIPQFYRDVLILAFQAYIEESDQKTQPDTGHLPNAVAAAARVADAIIDTSSKGQLHKALEGIADRFGFPMPVLSRVLAKTPEDFKQHCKMIEMSFLALPEHFEQYLASSDNLSESDLAENEDVGGDFSFYLDEIRQAIANHETISSIITTAMEALAFGQKFDRVMLLFADEDDGVLYGKMSLGESFGVEPRSVRRDLEQLTVDSAPDVKALIEGTVEVFGDPIFQDGWPFAAVPVGCSDRALGVLYADMREGSANSGRALDSTVQLALTMLADLLDEAVQKNAE